MAIEIQRLTSLIEYAQHTARLRTKPVATVTQHGQLAFYEHQLQGLPGIRLNTSQAEDEDEIWLQVDRLHETKPPEPRAVDLKPWLLNSNDPYSEPTLKAQIFAHELNPQASRSDEMVSLEGYEHKETIKAQLKQYLETVWSYWSNEEKARRKTIKLYSQLFTLKQQLEGSIVEAQLELCWGVGIGIWKCQGTTVGYPLITRQVELALNADTASIEIRPRDADARLEVDWYASVDNPGLGTLEKAAREFFSSSTKTFSPFDRGTFEALLRAAATNLDPNGVYRPDKSPAEDRSLPKPEENLCVTDTWVLFARPRTNSIYLQDLERFKAIVSKTEETGVIPGALAEIVLEPSSSNVEIELPNFRGVSTTYQDGPTAQNCKDLFFPKPFNEEQTRIVQLLEVTNGVVVQGPPGTGKTHTIANVICHYLANGQRVLVTSMKEPALTVLHGQLPEEIRPLAITLLTNERDGMRQFEHSIQKIASEVQVLDRTATKRELRNLEDTISNLHARLAKIDKDIGDWAKKNLLEIQLGAERISPQDAAREVVEHILDGGVIPDAISVGEEYVPRFTDEDIRQLRHARAVLGSDITYLGCSLPQVVEFPDTKTLLQVHQDLSRFTILTTEVEKGEVLPLADTTQQTLSAAQVVLGDIGRYKTLVSEIAAANKGWTAELVSYLQDGKFSDNIKILEAIGAELEQAGVTRTSFIARPVVVPVDFDLDVDLVTAVTNLAAGKQPFGILGVFGKTEQKRKLGQISVVGRLPTGLEDWVHVASYLNLLSKLRELAFRWNAIADEIGIEVLPGTEPQHGVEAASLYSLYKVVKQAVELEGRILQQAKVIAPTWVYVKVISQKQASIDELERVLHHHLTKSRLANVWTVKEKFQKVLEQRTGDVVNEIRKFLDSVLGSPNVKDNEMQARWSSLMEELVRVNGLNSSLKIVKRVSELIEVSGAPKYAALLCKPIDGAIDTLLPDDWHVQWRLKRLATYLEHIDAQDELKKLSGVRTELENDLARAYQRIVAKQTWLKLAENATPNIRSALQAYLTAIQKIGKGTGKRAVRYRLDARKAAGQANPAVPCWIMPHHRVSESLPAELGCFDLVIIDEASQSDLAALPALLRAKKVLIVGDDKQVSPEGVGLEEEKVRSLMGRFLTTQVETYRPQMSPERSIYDLFKVVFAKSSVMLREHFRCVNPIIEYSKREFYNHELCPLRLPKASERLDPPLIDVVIEDGYRDGDVNRAEAKFVVDEIGRIVADRRLSSRTIGVVSLLADKQSYEIWERLEEMYGPEIIEKHKIACGDARTFQGKERDIMFLTMVSAPNDVGAPLSRDTFRQRFNVAASRARDRMYLVRSVEMEHLSEADVLRRGLISHFSAPYANDEARVNDLRGLCESPFEREMYDELTARGYWVTPQVRVGQFRIDLVVEGHNDARLAIECDGDKYHGPEKWGDDMQRQRILERAGWRFWRCFASSFIRRRQQVLSDLCRTLAEHHIEPTGHTRAPSSIHSEQRRIVTETL